ncbi:hypothetical protein [Variovorax soli]|uniref:H+/gluconate symporter-like permease n=1 Tax=Variovorax soli TaxID=376815 RepID=A0ABU1NMV5_9BURK|nr:hypothetical protein [Variovorax soli]MDR6539784.1 H+/gluconate symporter-like permease [Variovorax soli]
MNSPARMHGKHRRLFGWVAAVSTILVLGLLSLDVIFPPAPAAPYASSPGTDFQRLLLVIAFLIALASFAGAIIATLLESMAKRKEWEEDATPARHGRTALAEEPANERLRALRAVISSLEESQVESL